MLFEFPTIVVVVVKAITMATPHLLACFFAMIIHDSMSIIMRKLIRPRLDTVIKNTTLNWLISKYESWIIFIPFLVIMIKYHHNYRDVFKQAGRFGSVYIKVVHLVAHVANLCLWKVISCTLKGLRVLLTNEISVTVSNIARLSVSAKNLEYSKTGPEYGEKTLSGALLGIVNASIWLLDEQEKRFDDQLTFSS